MPCACNSQVEGQLRLITTVVLLVEPALCFWRFWFVSRFHESAQGVRLLSLTAPL